MITLTKFRQNPFAAGSDDDPIYLFVDPKSGNILFAGSASLGGRDKQFALRQDDAYSDIVLEVRADGVRVAFDVALVKNRSDAEEWVEAANRMLSTFTQ